MQIPMAMLVGIMTITVVLVIVGPIQDISFNKQVLNLFLIWAFLTGVMMITVACFGLAGKGILASDQSKRLMRQVEELAPTTTLKILLLGLTITVPMMIMLTIFTGVLTMMGH